MWVKWLTSVLKRVMGPISTLHSPILFYIMKVQLDCRELELLL